MIIVSQENFLKTYPKILTNFIKSGRAQKIGLDMTSAHGLKHENGRIPKDLQVNQNSENIVNQESYLKTYPNGQRLFTRKNGKVGEII